MAVALVVIGGGFAISGRGRLWARIVCGVISALLIVGVTITTFNIAGPRLAVTEPRGVWVALLASFPAHPARDCGFNPVPAGRRSPGRRPCGRGIRTAGNGSVSLPPS